MIFSMLGVPQPKPEEPEVELFPPRDIVFDWRYAQLRRAGYDPQAAALIASDRDVDLHRAMGLLEQGCDVEVALRVLL